MEKDNKQKPTISQKEDEFKSEFIIPESLKYRMFEKEAVELYIKSGGNRASSHFFYMRYDDVFDSYKYCRFREYAAYLSFRLAFNYTRWFWFYKELGHKFEWCMTAGDFFLDDVLAEAPYKKGISDELFNASLKAYVDADISLENDIACFKHCMKDFPDEHEYLLHRDYILKEYGKSI